MKRKAPFFLPLPLSVFALLILLLAFALRFHLLGAQSLWNDEGNSYVQATRSLSEIAANAARDIHPPGYYWLLHLWRILTGDTEFALRSLSAFASVLTVAFTFALGRRLYGGVAGLAAALFLALNTFSIYYAQEARMYTLLALWGAAGMWAMVKFVTSSHWRKGEHLKWALVLALVNAAGLWTQYAYPFIMLAQGVVFVVWLLHRIGIGGALRAFGIYVLANLLTIALYLPWLPTALDRITTWPNTGEPIPLNTAAQTILGWFTFGITFSATDPSWVAVALLLLLFGLRVERPVVNLWRLVVPVVWVVVPVGLFLAFGLFREANLKFLLPAQVGFVLWMGRGVWVLWDLPLLKSPPLRSSPSQWGGVIAHLAAVAVVLGLSANLWRGLDPLYHHPDYQRDDYRQIVSDITADLHPDGAIILDAPNQEEVFHYYYDASAPVYPLPPGLGGDDAETQAHVEALIDDFGHISAVFWGEAERDPNRVVEATLNSGAYEISSQWYGDVRLVQYVTPVEMTIREDVQVPFGEAITLESYALSDITFTPGDVLQIRLRWRTDAPLETRYKVFVQLLDAGGQLVAQRDSEPGGGLAPTTTWPQASPIIDNHALMIPNDLPPAHYRLIIGLYNMDDPQQRLPVGEMDHLVLSEIQVN